MGLFKRAMVAGAVHELTAQGIVKWATEELRDEATDIIADNTTDDIIPEQVPPEGMSEPEAEELLNKIVEVSEILANQSAPVDTQLNKMAAETSYENAAEKTAIRLMEKAAEETMSVTGPDIPGQGTPKEVEGPTAETEIDKVKTPSSEAVVPQGQTALDTKPGAIGKEGPQDEQPGAVESPPTSEASKLASLFKRLGVQKTAGLSGASLSGGSPGGPTPTPRKDLDDNLDIPNVVAKSQGKTVQNIPDKAMLGALMPQKEKPGPTDATPNEPAKDAITKQAEELMKNPTGKLALQKIADVVQRLAPQYQQTPEQAASQVLNNLSNIL